MADGLVFELDGREVVALADRMRGDARARVTRLMPVAATMLVAAVQDVFEAEGPGWEPLKESTIARRRENSSHKILQDSGVMAGTIEPVHGVDYAEARAGVPYAIYHVEGGPHLPVRDPFDLGPFEGPLLDDFADMLARELAQ